ncbi:MAG: CPBP family intramembrane metalloprotease [Opitutales bacterium]|nr:CPBP family intramembrane metalloprotease [Opitutales bacterium]
MQIFFSLFFLASGVPFFLRLSGHKGCRQVGFDMSLADFFLISAMVAVSILLGSLFGSAMKGIFSADIFLGTAAMHVLAMVSVLVFARVSDSKPVFFWGGGVGRKLKLWLKGAGYLAGTLFCILAVANIWAMILLEFGIEPSEQDVVEYFGSSEGIARVFAFISIAFIAPVAEELVFRGAMYGALKNKIGAVAAALIVSALFGAIHFNMVAFLPIFVLSLLLILLYERYGDLTAPIAAHSAFNTIMAVLILFRDYLNV